MIRFPVYIAAVVMLFFASTETRADVDKDSIFLEARIPASELDLILLEFQRSWSSLFLGKDSSGSEKYPLIKKVGVAAEFRYSKDRIQITGWLMNLDSFLALGPEDRKAVVKQVIEAAKASLFWKTILLDKKTLKETTLTKSHLTLALMLNDLETDDKGQFIREFLLPNGIGVGQAGYKDGQFVYSRDYYLTLRIVQGKAVVGDGKQFIIENDD